MPKVTLRQLRFLIIVTLGISLSVVFVVLLIPISLISTEGARSFYEKLVDVDGVLLGFSGIVFAVIFQRSEKRDEKQVVTLVADFCVVVACYLGSILFSLVMLLVLGVATVSGYPLLIPLLTLLMGTIFLFDAIIDAYF